MTNFPQAENLIRQAIIEDIGDGDHTSLATIPKEAKGKARLLIKEEGVLAGVQVAKMVFKLVDPEIIFIPYLEDGTKVFAGDIAFEVEGSSRSILTSERLVLNFMQRMSGIATQTNRLCRMIEDLPARLLDTRKTTPNMRLFEKLAVRIGGGYNHRFGLFDMILIKNNHVDFAGGIEAALKSTDIYLARVGKKLRIEIEVRNFKELEEALNVGGFHRIMLDNFSPEALRKAIEIIDGRYETEASGGITEESLREYAETGVEFISVGALTHQIKSLDMSLRAVN
jgi:nicotinate-nucleotide pyrophosphorylase (carboxylating)